MIKEEKNMLKPDYAVHPGITLREKLEELNIFPKEFAIRIGKPIKTISNVLNGKCSITPEMAIQFEKVLHIPASFWISKQSSYNEFIAREKERDKLNIDIPWSKNFPYSMLAKLGYVKSVRNLKERAKELLSFFNISTSEAWKNIYFNQEVPVFFRISLKNRKNPYAISALLRMGEIEASKLNAQSFNRKKLKDIIIELKEIMRSETSDYLKKIQECCLKVGVKVVYTVNLPKTSINGVVRWIDDNPVIQLTDKYKRYDIFWFSLFHELGHVILHGNKKNIFLENIEDIEDKNEEERGADRFAANYLLDEREFNQILDKISSLPPGGKNEEAIIEIIEDFAEKFKTHKSIIAGRILHCKEELYALGFLQKSIKKVDFAEIIGACDERKSA